MNTEKSLDWRCEIDRDNIRVFQFSEITNGFIKTGTYNIAHYGTYCNRCGRPLQMKSLGSCNNRKSHEYLTYSDGIFFIGFYYDKLDSKSKQRKDILTSHILKLQQDEEYAIPLSIAMYALAKRDFPFLLQVDSIVPVPNNKKDPFFDAKAMGLAKQFYKLASKNNHDMEFSTCLIKKRKIKSHRITQEKREEIVSKIFGVENSINIRDKSILLIDDNLTSGINAGECSKILKKEGANRVFVYVAGRTL